ncbi:alpha/beta hydrolase [Salidesulfovibrio brasiliensis]|uniref:alpha/beta hydrolase n=1 Tax=Salidesulfovibrio brasiliensis TaxID=221711 RepID=UPI0006D21D72|nr:alpha/beta hydrolase [Salidesulfovibrio brasiliensis]
MIAVLKMLLLVAGGTYLAMVLFVFFSQRGMVYMPSRELGATPSDADLPYEEVYLETRQGTRIHGWFIPHPQAELSVLFCHGNAGNISHRLETARILNELGVSAFFFDYSGYGNSAGKPRNPQPKRTPAPHGTGWRRGLSLSESCCTGGPSAAVWPCRWRMSWLPKGCIRPG